MTVAYDEETDILTIVLTDRSVAYSREGERGVVVDYDAEDGFVAVEVVDASLLFDDPAAIAMQAQARAKEANGTI